MANIGSITQGSYYRGDENLGGGSFGVAKLNLQPLDDLAKYTFLYSKSEYDQRQKDAESAANQIAQVTSYDLTTGIKKDADVLQKKYSGILDFLKTNPGALDYRNKKAWMEYRRLRGDIENDITSAGVRDTMFKIRQNEIQNMNNVSEKDRLQKNLDEEIEATDIRTPLKVTSQYDVTPIVYSAPKKLSFDVSKEYPNYLSVAEVLTTDMGDVNRQANAAVLGLSRFTNPQTQQEREQFQAQINSGKLEPVLSSKYLSSIMPDYVKDGAFDYEAALNSGNSLLAGNISNVIAYNRRMDEMVKAIESGAFQDRLSGNVPAFGYNGLNKVDYQKIDLSKGFISPEELVKMRILGLGDATTSKTKLTPTDNEIQRQQMKQQDWYNRANIGLGYEKLKSQEERWSSMTGGTDNAKNAAMNKAKRIYESLVQLTDKNGVISPDKLRQLDQEQLRFLGGQQIVKNTTGTSTPTSIYKPLEFTEDKEYAIRVANGKIMVLGPIGESKTLEKTENGEYVGHWDNTKSTNLLNIATNILNEEVRTASGKELQAYVDMDDQDNVNLSNPAPQSTGGKSTVIDGHVIPPGAKVVYSVKTSKALGYELNGQKHKF